MTKVPNIYIERERHRKREREKESEREKRARENKMTKVPNPYSLSWDIIHIIHMLSMHNLA